MEDADALHITLQFIVRGFRNTELKFLLKSANVDASGDKNILQERALQLVQNPSEYIIGIIKKLQRQTFSPVQTTTNPAASQIHDVAIKKLLPSCFFKIVYTIEEAHIFDVEQNPHGVYFFQIPHKIGKCLIKKNEGNCQKTHIAQLRVSKVNEADNFFPEALFISCNRDTVTLPEFVPRKMKRPCLPLDISLHLRSEPEVNDITMTWKKDDHHASVLAIALHIVYRLTVDEVLDRLHHGGTISELESLSLVAKNFKQDGNEGIEPTIVSASTICPLGKMPISTPCRATSCTHVQCFDGKMFLEMNEQTPKWICPICDKPILSTDIKIDELWVKILNSVPQYLLNESKPDVQFSKDGTWQLVTAEVRKLKLNRLFEEPKIETTDDSDNELNEVVIDISDDDDIGCTFVSPQLQKTNYATNVLRQS